MPKNGNYKILIVEDDLFLLGMYATKFELENFKVSTAEDAEKGLEIISKDIPDIILLDIILPGIDGFEFLKRIKKDSKTNKIPVILLTNLSQKDSVEKGLALGANDYLIKAHFMPSEVIDKIKNLVQESKKK
ncbi:MAG: response regulator [Patescibacteria group bacterium]|nr:response regulator [Patescibacteria group bacterium]